MNVAEVPPPRVVAARLLFPAIVLGGAVGLALVLACASLPLPEARLEGAIRLAVALWIAVVGGAVAVTVAVLRRTVPLYRTLRRAYRRAEEQVPPPSEAALQDAFAATDWMTVGTGSAAGLVVLTDLAGVPGLSGYAPGLRVGVDLVALGLVLGAAQPARMRWRRAVWSWLDLVRPEEMPLATAPSVARRTAGRVAALVGVVALGATAVVAVHVATLVPRGTPATADLIVVMLALGVTLAGVLGVGLATMAAYRLGARAAGDLQRVMVRIGELVDRGDSAPVAASATTRAGRELEDAVGALAERYATASAGEARARAAIEEAQQLKSRFMAFMSHDLRSPLNAIRGFAEVLAQGTEGRLNEAQQESVRMIREGGDELLWLVGDILDSAKLESGRLELHPRWTPSVEIVTEAVREARALSRQKPLELVTELEPGLPPVYVDRERIVQALLGVLGHMVRLMPEGTVRVRAHAASGPPGPGRQLRIVVTDTTGAIRAEDREQLCETFRAIDEPTGQRVGGVRLGLALARTLVTEHGGALWHESPEDAQTTFCLALPVDDGR